MTKKEFSFLLTLVVATMFWSIASFASVESSLMAVQTKLIGTILPLASIIGLVFAGLSFVYGSPNARNHLVLAIIGAIVGFGAPSIVSWIQSIIH